MSAKIPKPAVHPVIVENIPAEMQAMPHWLAWLYEYKGTEDKGKYTKTPYDPVHVRPSQTATTPFTDAINGYNQKKFDGIGFQLTGSGLVCIDIDDCLSDDGEPNDTAAQILSKTPPDTYVELSPSRRGLHIWGRGVKRNDDCKSQQLHVELYDKARYITVTGGKLAGYASQIGDIQAAIDHVHAMIVAARPRPAMKTQPAQPAAANPVAGTLSDADVIRAASHCNKPNPNTGESMGTVFQRFYEQGYTDGDGYASQSEADMAFMGLLRFYTGGNAEQMERIFCQSKLYRPDKKGQYVARTIKSVLTDPNWDGKTYQPPRPAQPAPPAQDNEKICQQYGYNQYKKASQLLLDLKGKPLKIWENVDLILQANGYTARVNELSHQLKIYKDDRPLAIKPDDFAIDLMTMCVLNGMSISPDKLLLIIKRIGYNNKFNPWQDYLMAAWRKWRNTHREGNITDMVNVLMDCLEFQPTANIPVSRVLLTKWAVMACRLAFNTLDGDNVVSPQGILVLQGPQGIGKTHLLYTLAPSKDMVQEGVCLDPRDKDSVAQATSYAIVELGELARTMKEINALKAFFTRPKDTYRVPYGRATNEYPRFTSYIGTTNDRQFLKDETGDRRYWVLELQNIDREKLNKTVRAVDFWGYAMHLAFTEKVDYRLTREERADIEAVNAPHRIITNEEQALEDVYDWADEQRTNLQTPTEIAQELQNHGCKQAKNVTIGRILNTWADQGKHGLRRTHKSGYGSKWFYAMPAVTTDTSY